MVLGDPCLSLVDFPKLVFSTWFVCSETILSLVSRWASGRMPAVFVPSRRRSGFSQMRSRGTAAGTVWKQCGRAAVFDFLTFDLLVPRCRCFALLKAKRKTYLSNKSALKASLNLFFLVYHIELLNHPFVRIIILFRSVFVCPAYFSGILLLSYTTKVIIVTTYWMNAMMQYVSRQAGLWQFQKEGLILTKQSFGDILNNLNLLKFLRNN